MTTVKLLAQFRGPGGGAAFPGETINVDADTAMNLIRSRSAVAVAGNEAAPVAPVKRATKPVTDASALKGFAKLHWLRQQIKARGVEPAGRTIAAMTDQLRSLG